MRIKKDEHKRNFVQYNQNPIHGIYCHVLEYILVTLDMFHFERSEVKS